MCTVRIGVLVLIAAGRLKLAEEAHLIFMRSEESLSRNVYLTLAESYPGQPIFRKIAITSEQTHTEEILETLIKFKIDDPEPNVDEPGYVGVFESPYFGFFYNDKFNMLIGNAKTLLSALEVGAFIEEHDMEDINYCNDVICNVFELNEGTPCGLTATNVRTF